MSMLLKLFAERLLLRFISQQWLYCSTFFLAAIPLCTVGSFWCRPAVVDAVLLQALSAFLLVAPAENATAVQNSRGMVEFRSTLLHVLEAVSQVSRTELMLLACVRGSVGVPPAPPLRCSPLCGHMCLL